MIYLVAGNLEQMPELTLHDLGFQVRRFIINGSDDLQSLQTELNDTVLAIIGYGEAGWRAVQQLQTAAKIFIRWQTATPPWFLAPYSIAAVKKSLHEYDMLLSMIAKNNINFLADSEFSRDQLQILGVAPERINIIFPFLEEQNTTDSQPVLEPEIVKILYSGGIGPQQGHKHILFMAHHLQKILNKPLQIYFSASPDSALSRYITELRYLAAQLALDIKFSLPEDLPSVYVCMTEHESSGSDVISAMRKKIPVVGYRNGALAEVLKHHPLACDTLNYQDIARNIAEVVQDQSLRQKILDFQSLEILPLYSRERIESQMREAIELRGEGRGEGCKNSPQHYVTRHDLVAYRQLLQQINEGAYSLREQALAIPFCSQGSILNRCITWLKKISLRLQEGMVNTIDIAQQPVNQRLNDLNNKVDNILIYLHNKHEKNK